MLSRLSSFSGPLSPLFRIPVGGFTTNGLILRYVIGDTDSYSGTTNITDLQSNSNGTLISGPTYSINGYINFDGINDYVMTNTSLNSKLSPNTSSTIISVFIWIYPQDDGVIVTEQGTTSLNGGWHTSIIEIVSGQLKFSVWPRTFIITSSISISLNNWYYVGLTYDGTTLRAYANGQLAGSAVFVRSAPNPINGLYYAIAAEDTTDLDGQVLSGPGGTFAKMKFGDFQVYNIALSQQQVINNYNYTKNNYIYTEDMLIWIDANDPESFSGGTVFDISGNNYHHSLTSGATSSNIDGIKCFDCTTGSKRIVVNGTGPTLSTTGYTYVVWARLISDNSEFRTLLYTKSPRYTPITIPGESNTLGYWDNEFRSSGYDTTSLVGVWVQYSVVGDNSSQTFYINDYQVGSSISYGSGGNLHDGLGNNLGSSQPFGHVGNMMLYNKKLTLEEIKQNYDALKHVYTPGFVTNDLLLMLDANETSSYPGSGTIWYDIAGSSQDMTLVNSPTFVSGTVSYFDFNGTTQFATGTGVTVPTTAYTKSVWVWVDAFGENNIVSGFNGIGGHFLFMGSVSFTKLFVGHHNQGVAFTSYGSSASISLNTWYNITVTFNTIDGMKIYINGQLDSSHNMKIAHTGSGSTNLASYSNSGGNQLNGRISKVYTYGRALTESEVEQNFFYDREKFGIEVLETFTTVGSTTWTAPIGVTSVEYLVVAGGGGAGNGFDNAGGGGGAGGMVLTGIINVTPGQSYTITVGDGGIGGANARVNNAGTDGENSVFGSITALGGGRGQGSRTGGLPGAKYTDVSAATGGAGSGGGFGGKGGGGVINGFNNSGTTGGAGGNGVSSSISGTSVTYGAGGAGGNAGTQNSGVNGTSNSGNGGRAGGAAVASSTGGGNGGSGIVIIRY
jgi:hypothetical protein